MNATVFEVAVEPTTWTAAACCRFTQAALLPPKSLRDREHLRLAHVR